MQNIHYTFNTVDRFNTQCYNIGISNVSYVHLLINMETFSEIMGKDLCQICTYYF